MQAKHLIASITLSSLIFSSIAFAQTPAPAPGATQTEQQKQAQKEVEKKALVLLEDTIADAQSLRVLENRALVTATAADLLWTRDEKRARTLFTDALNTLASARASSTANTEELEDNRGYRNYASYMASAMRQQLLQMVARHDATLALDLLRAGSSAKQTSASSASTASPAQANLNRERVDEDARLEQSLIAQIAATDPKMALRVAEESLAKGVSGNLLSTLHMLQRKDPETATKLAGSIVERLRTTNFQTNPESVFVLTQLLDMGAHPERYAPQRQLTAGNAATTAATTEVAKKPQPLINETALRDLTDVVASALLNNGAMNGIIYQAPTLLPLIEKYAPTRAAQVRRKLADFKQTIDPQQQVFMQYQEQLQNGTTDSLLQAASKAPPQVRDMLYQSAAWKAIAQNDTAYARQIIQDNIINTRERDQLLAQIDRQALTQSLRQGKLDEARQMLRARGTRSKKDQAMMLAMLAQVAAKKGDRKFALEVLDEARQFVPNSQAQNQDQIDAQLAVAAAYTFVEPTRSFEIIEPMIDQANELIRAAALLDKFGNSGQRFFRNGELMLSMAGASSFAIRSRYGRALTLLANADFDRAHSLADRFQQPELRVMARLLIAQGALDTAQQSNMPQSELDFMPGETYAIGTGAVLIGNQ